MSDVEYEASNLTLPMRNNDQMRCIAVLSITLSGQSQNLAALFGGLGSGHFLTVQPDLASSDGKCYLAFGSSAATIDETALGTGTTVCYVKGHLQELTGRPVGGEQVASGAATYITHRFIHWKGTTSGYLRIYRSSTASGQTPGQAFPPP